MELAAKRASQKRNPAAAAPQSAAMLGAELGRRWRGILVKRRIFTPRSRVLALAAPAAAQGYEPGAGHGGLPPYEVITIAALDRVRPDRSAGAARPELRAARDGDNDREVRVIVNARSGDILSVTPDEIASRMPPPRGGVTMGPMSGCRLATCLGSSADLSADAAGGYRAGARLIGRTTSGSLPPIRTAPRPPAAMPGALPSRSSNAAPLPPRGTGDAGAATTSLSPPSGDRTSSRADRRPRAACCRRRRSVSRSAPRRLPAEAEAGEARGRSAAEAAPLPKPKPARHLPSADRLPRPRLRTTSSRRATARPPAARRDAALASRATTTTQNKSAPGLPGRSTLRKNR